MYRGNLGAYVGILILVVAVFLVAGTWITQLLWGWVIPDVFSGAVKQNVLPASITFWQAFKLALLIGILFGGSHASSSSK